MVVAWFDLDVAGFELGDGFVFVCGESLVHRSVDECVPLGAGVVGPFEGRAGGEERGGCHPRNDVPSSLNVDEHWVGCRHPLEGQRVGFGSLLCHVDHQIFRYLLTSQVSTTVEYSAHSARL